MPQRDARMPRKGIGGKPELDFNFGFQLTQIQTRYIIINNVENRVHIPFTLTRSAPEDVRLGVVDVDGDIVGELDASVVVGVRVAAA